jgi:hypothetical protein
MISVTTSFGNRVRSQILFPVDNWESQMLHLHLLCPNFLSHFCNRSLPQNIKGKQQLIFTFTYTHTHVGVNEKSALN